MFLNSKTIRLYESRKRMHYDLRVMDIKSIHQTKDDNGNGRLVLKFNQGGTFYTGVQYGWLRNALIKLGWKENGGEMNSLRNYIEKHEETLITIAIVAVIDHFVLGGTLKGKIQSFLNKLLDVQLKAVDSE